MKQHTLAVEALAKTVRGFYESRTPFRIYHGSTNSTRRSQRRRDNTVDTSGLNRVLRVDRTSRTAIVEPNVSMDALVHATLEHDGLVPPVVMEFPGITVGGGFSGSSGESSSFRYGAFDATINWIEIVLPNGEVSKASKNEKPDLFWGAASAFGTLGVVTLLEIGLIEAKKYVELTYSLSGSVAEATVSIQQETSKPENDFVDAIAYSTKAVVVCTGRMTNQVEGEATMSFRRPKDPWFYIHVEKVMQQLKKGPGVIDYVPLVDYLFRYDRGGFWAARYAFKYFITPFNRVTRRVLDPFMYTRVMYRALHQSGLSDFYLLQDVGIPFDKAGEFQEWLDEHVKVFPLWLCPLRLRRTSPDSRHGLHSEFGDPDTPDLLNFGIWGPISFNRREVVTLNRALEQKVAELGGKKWLYAHAYYTEEEFWAQYDKESYKSLREKYSATYLPSVYDKVKVDVDAEEAAARATRRTRMEARFWGVWPMRGLRGVYKAVVGGDYLLRK